MESFCEICAREVHPVNLQSYTKPIDHLWNYLYHQNVRETLLPEDTEETEVPRLTFTFSVGKSTKTGGDDEEVNREPLLVCGECNKQLEMLNKLHQKLEGMRKAVEDKVREINSRFDGCWEERRERKNRNLQRFCKERKMDVAMTGSVVGQGNVARMVQFVGNLCDGIKSTGSEQKIKQSRSENKRQPERLAEETRTRCQEISEGDFLEDHNLSQDHLQLEFEEDFIPVKVEMEHDLDSDIYTDFRDPLGDPPAALPPPPPHPSSLSMGRRKRAKRNQPPLPSSPASSSARPPTRVHRRIPCNVCGKLISEISMHIHLRVHTGAKPYPCEYCDKRFSQAISLLKHRRTHTGEAPYQCNLCPQRFKENKSLQTHKNSKHGYF